MLVGLKTYNDLFSKRKHVQVDQFVEALENFAYIERTYDVCIARDFYYDMHTTCRLVYSTCSSGGKFKRMEGKNQIHSTQVMLLQNTVLILYSK